MEKKIFLARATIKRSEYMGDTTSFEDVRLVFAADEGEAFDKYEAYWESRSEAYSLDFSVMSLDVTAAIE